MRIELPPEVTRRLGHLLFSIPLPPCRPRTTWRIGPAETYGPVGVAAGLDKEGLYTRFLSSFCPGFIVVGSTTPRRRRGNKPPLTARLRPLSFVNAMGLPSPGLPAVLARISDVDYPLFISLAGFSPQDFEIQLEHLGRYAGPNIRAVEINLSSPTYKGLWDRGWDLESKLPLFLKVGPTADLRLYFDLAKRRGYGLVLTNTLPVEDKRLGAGRGGLSGLLLYPVLLKMLEKARERVGRDVPIIAVGGVMSCAQAREVLKLADGIEVLTGVLYYGPLLLKVLNGCSAHRPPPHTSA
ncbi:MAG: dihydroorotate dehydrogenase 2 [Thermoproteus sp. AZ2]|jgi:dihydroorotate dehydrogenase (fumarate)|uniref:Dihydroorotate dehydrogenase 2 n=1 Tax=Thermoproteus sp. AZ2 TaxID=1609232 RepID=A0ACC6V2R7_9CREN|nr:MAG: dihydroorotate dehydrogenase [Thermoproteus sp. AZ2]